MSKLKSDLDSSNMWEEADRVALLGLFPKFQRSNYKFDFIDLFAGIGGIRKGFESIGGRCLFTSEWNEYAQKTYRANFPNCTDHRFNGDLKEVTQPDGFTDERALSRIREEIPAHDVLLAGFPCQPFSIAGVSKKNSLGRSHGFECEDQGQLFFDIIRILKAKSPAVFVLENVKNLKSHDKGNTFKVIKSELTRAGYWISNLNEENPDPKIVDGAKFLPQHRERIILVGFRMDLVSEYQIDEKFDLKNIEDVLPASRPTLKEILEPNSQVDPKYTLTPKLWGYLQNYAAKHKAKGNGFGYGLVSHDSPVPTRTLSARYYKDGSEILIRQDDMKDDPVRAGRPRRLTPQECARLMGFSKTKEDDFEIPVSDTQAYKQFGNSVVVPVFEAIAKLIAPCLEEIKEGQAKKVAA